MKKTNNMPLYHQVHLLLITMKMIVKKKKNMACKCINRKVRKLHLWGKLKVAVAAAIIMEKRKHIFHIKMKCFYKDK